MADSEQGNVPDEEQVEDLDETKAESEEDEGDDVEGHLFDSFQKVQTFQKVAPITQKGAPLGDLGGLRFDKH